MFDGVAVPFDVDHRSPLSLSAKRPPGVLGGKSCQVIPSLLFRAWLLFCGEPKLTPNETQTPPRFTSPLESGLMPRRNAVGIATWRVISSGTCKLKLSHIWCPSACLHRGRAFPGSINLDQWNRRFKDARVESSNPVPSFQIAGAPAFNIEFDSVC